MITNNCNSNKHLAQVRTSAAVSCISRKGVLKSFPCSFSSVRPLESTRPGDVTVVRSGFHGAHSRFFKQYGFHPASYQFSANDVLIKTEIVRHQYFRLSQGLSKRCQYLPEQSPILSLLCLAIRGA